MLKRKLPFAIRDERGLGVIEVLLAMAISSLILAALTTATLRLTRFQDGNNAQITANRNSENVMNYIAADVRRAQWVNGADGVTPLSAIPEPAITLQWVDYTDGGDIRSVKYERDSGSGRLKRTYDQDPFSLVGRGVVYLGFLQDATTGKVTVILDVTTTGEPLPRQRSFDLDPRPRQP